MSAVSEITKTHEIGGEKDLFVTIAHDIENLKANEAISIVPVLMESVDENYFKLGGVLSLIQRNKLFEEEDFTNFRTFVETRYGIAYRKSMYWVHIYNTLIEAEIPWIKVKDVGWTKLKEMASILTLENVDEWVQRALSSTTLQLQEAVKLAQQGKLETSGIEPEEGGESKVTTVTFRVHPDQKTIIKEAVEKARHEANTEYDSVALEAICMNYMSGGNVTGLSLKDTMAKYQPEDVLTAFESAFPMFTLTATIKK